MADEKEGEPKDGTDDKSGKETGGAGKKGEGEGDAPKTYTQDELDAALARDRQDRKRTTAATKPTAIKKTKAGEEDGDSEEKAELHRRAEAAEAQLRARDARDAVERAAKEAGFTNPNKIYRLIRDDLIFDESTGKPENVKDLITIARRDFAEELAAKTPGSADGGAGKGGGGAAKSSMNDFIRKATGRT